MEPSWTPDLSGYRMPAYLALAEAIAEDIRIGRLPPNARLPTQRGLAAALSLNFTTVARGYAEARKRGLIDSHVGRGTFVKRRLPAPRRRTWRPDLIDRAMNLPPEPDDPDLLQAMQHDYNDLVADLSILLRYQEAGGSANDKVSGIRWLASRGVTTAPDTMVIAPGTHPALQALIAQCCPPGTAMACENVTYPGIPKLARQLGIALIGLPMDREGLLPDALENAITTQRVRAVYCNPTIQNPTTLTISPTRRQELVHVMRRHGVPMIEDDIYGLLPQGAPPAFATLAPDLTYHVHGLAKTVGAGLRVAYVSGPDRQSMSTLADRLKIATVMPSPLTSALASRWIDSGVAERILAFVRAESNVRQRLVRERLPAHTFSADPDGFHVWITPPAPWTALEFAAALRGLSLSLVDCAPFLAGPTTCNGVRLCLGGIADRAATETGLDFIAATLAHPPERSER